MTMRKDSWPPYVDRMMRLKITLDQYDVHPSKSITFKEPRVDSVCSLLNGITEIMEREVFVDELLDKDKLMKELEGKK